METRVAVMSIIVEDTRSIETLNNILHEYREYIIGRMGLPYRPKGINIISIALDAVTTSGHAQKLSATGLYSTARAANINLFRPVLRKRHVEIC